MFSFAILHSLNLPQTTVKPLMKTWVDLYGTFSRLAAMVTNVEANTDCAEFCCQLSEICANDKRLKVTMVTQSLPSLYDHKFWLTIYWYSP